MDWLAYDLDGLRTRPSAALMHEIVLLSASPLQTLPRHISPPPHLSTRSMVMADLSEARLGLLPRERRL